jgi:hypothetical protein
LCLVPFFGRYDFIIKGVISDSLYFTYANLDGNHMVILKFFMDSKNIDYALEVTENISSTL